MPNRLRFLGEITYDDTKCAHPWKTPSARRLRVDEVRHTSKCKSELEERYCGTPAGTVTVVHDLDVGIPATEFRIDNDEADSPIRGNA